MMLIRPEQPSDVPKIRDVNCAAFETAAEADIVDALRSDAEHVLSLVAEEDGDIVRHPGR